MINPIPKDAGYVNDPLKYRGLSLQCCLYKILSSIINKRIVAHLTENDIIEDEQNGFRKGRSCLHHVFTLCCTIRNSLNAKYSKDRHVYSAFVDFQKAFDVIDHKMMYYRLIENGITGKILQLIKQFYVDNCNIIRINNMFTDSFNSENDLRQGDNISPTNFCQFINDLIHKLKSRNKGVWLDSQTNLTVLAYADDIVILSKNEADLQLLLNDLNEWCQKWHVIINTNKTKIVHFRRKGVKETDVQFMIANSKIETVSKYKYLGITLNYSINTDVVIKPLHGVAGRALSQVLSKTKDNYDLGNGSFTRLVESCVLPILDYACGEWNVGLKTVKLDQIQSKAIRFYLGLPRTSPTLSLNSEMGWTPRLVRRDVETIRLYNQIMKMDPSRLTQKVYIYEKACDGIWYQNLHNICDSIGCSELLVNNNVISIEFARNQLLKLYESEWRKGLDEGVKLQNYAKIKTEMDTEPFVKCNLTKEKRSLIAQLRSGVLALAIESDRRNGVPRDKRMCNHCKKDVETECHFLFECELYRDERLQLYEKIPELLHHSNHLIRLKMLCNMPYTFGNYLSKIWNKHGKYVINSQITR